MSVGWPENWMAGFFALVFLVFSIFPVVQASSNDFSIAVDPKDGWVDLRERLVQAGDTCTFVITVTNEGDNVDSYTLEASDTAGWNLELGDDQLKNLAAGDAKTTTLSVTVPEDTEVGFQNEITVGATNLAGVEENHTSAVGVLRGFDTNETYIATGIGIVIVAAVMIFMLWKGPLAGG